MSATAPQPRPTTVSAPPRKTPPPTPTPANQTAPAAASPPAAAPPVDTTPRTTAPPRGTVRAPAAPPTKVSKLGQVTTGVLDEAKRFVIYGTKGVGKSTLAGDIPGAIFLDLDMGSGHLPLTRYPLGSDGAEPTYQDVLDAIEDLMAGQHSYQAVVIDEASKLEALIHRHIVDLAGPDKQGNKPANVEEIGGGFQKGYRVAEQEFRVLLSRLDTLRVRRRMHVVVLSHSTISNQKNPGGEDYHRHQPQLNPFAAGVLCGGADVVAFATFDDVATRSGRKTIGKTGHRVIHTEHSAAWDAKSRLPLPKMIDLDESRPWAPFAQALHRLRTMSPTALRAEIDAQLERLGEHFTRENGAASTASAVRTAVTQAGDHIGDLHRFLSILQQATPVAEEHTA